MTVADGVFLTVEGTDGSGKSTQARSLAGRLRSTGRDVVLTREPGGSPGAEDIRSLVVSGEPGRWSPETEVLLFTAARRDHVERTILPALDRGAIVVCDRFVDSTRAYQGDGPLRTAVDRLHDLMIGIDPDLTLILDLDPETGLARAGARSSDGEDRFERRGVSFQARLRETYHAIAAAEPARCRLVDASRPLEEITDVLMAHALDLLETR